MNPTKRGFFFFNALFPFESQEKLASIGVETFIAF